MATEVAAKMATQVSDWNKIGDIKWVANEKWVSKGNKVNMDSMELGTMA